MIAKFLAADGSRLLLCAGNLDKSMIDHFSLHNENKKELLLHSSHGLLG